MCPSSPVQARRPHRRFHLWKIKWKRTEPYEFNIPSSKIVMVISEFRGPPSHRASVSGSSWCLRMGACASPVQHEWNQANGCQISSCTIPQASAGHEILNTFVRSRHFGALRCIHLPQRQWEFTSILFLVQIECAKVAYVMCVCVCLCELWISQKLLPTQLVLARAELRECYSCHVDFQLLFCKESGTISTSSSWA